jgi:opacity protein-like surface antigen
MKKNILIALLLLVSAGASAQLVKDTVRISWNVKAGVNFGRINMEDTNTKTGFYMGAGMECNFSGGWSLQPSLLFISKGAKVPGNMSITANYLELPVMLAQRDKLGQKVSIMYGVGFYVAMGIGGSVKVESEGEEASIGTFKTYTSGGESLRFMNRFDAGYATGLAVEFDPFAITLDIKIGLVDVGGSIRTKEVSGDLDFKNRSISVGVSYKFR